MLVTGYSTLDIVMFLADMYPLSAKQITDMLPKCGMSLMINKTPTNQRVKIIKQRFNSYAVYIDMEFVL